MYLINMFEKFSILNIKLKYDKSFIKTTDLTMLMNQLMSFM